MSARAPRVGPTPNRHLPWGTCRWCEQPITHQDGRPDNRRRWHQRPHERNCLEEWAWTQPGPARARLIDEQHGTCEACGYSETEDLWAMRRHLDLNPGTNRDDRYEAFWAARRRLRTLHLDHVRPLADGGTNDRANLQLLCETCHKAKTALEAAARAHRRRLERLEAAASSPATS